MEANVGYCYMALKVESEKGSFRIHCERIVGQVEKQTMPYRNVSPHGADDGSCIHCLGVIEQSPR